MNCTTTSKMPSRHCVVFKQIFVTALAEKRVLPILTQCMAKFKQITLCDDGGWDKIDDR